MKTFLGFSVSFLSLAIILTACKESSIDARSMADALSEEFTDGIEFKDGQTETGDLPDEGASTIKLYDIMAPHLFGPADLGFGEAMAEYDSWIQVTINTDSSDLTADGVIGAIAQIQQANKDDNSSRYFRITPPLEAITGNHVTMEARVHYFQRLAGNSFTIQMALLFSDGTRSGFTQWNIVTYPLSGDTTKISMCGCDQADLGFQNRSACEETQKFPWIFEEFDNPEMGPCSIWGSISGVFHEADQPDPQYPSGTFFYPPTSWGEGEGATTVEEAKACIIEFWCK